MSYAPKSKKSKIEEYLDNIGMIKELNFMRYDIIDYLEYFGLKLNLSQFLNCTSRIDVSLLAPVLYHSLITFEGSQCRGDCAEV